MASLAWSGAGSSGGGIMNNLTILCLRPILRLLPRSTRRVNHRVPPCDLPAAQTTQTMSTPLDRGSTFPLCAVCIEAGFATEATHQTRDGLCGCDQHIQELEQHGRAAVRRQRSAQPHGNMDRGASPARGTTGDRPADSRHQSAGLGDGSAGPSDDRVGSRNAYRSYVTGMAVRKGRGSRRARQLDKLEPEGYESRGT
jgi:hypothetical protein